MKNLGNSEKHLVVVMGGVKTGKTFAAKLAVIFLRAVYLNTDIIRWRMIKEGAIPANERYTEKRLKQVYDEFFSQARDWLRRGRNVVLDATFSKEEGRIRFRKLAEETGAKLTVFYVHCDEEVVKRRIADGVVQKEDTGSVFLPVRYKGDFSEAGWDVYNLIKETFTPVEGNHILIDGGASPEKVYFEIGAHLLPIDPLFSIS